MNTPTGALQRDKTLDYYGPMIRLTFALASSLIALAAHAQAPAETPPPSRLDGPLMYQLLQAEMQVASQEPAAGYAIMLDAANRTREPQLYDRAVNIALRSQSGEAALDAVKAWKTAHPDSLEASRYELHILVAMNRPEATLAPLQATLRLTPESERMELIDALPRMFARLSPREASANTVQKALEPYLKTSKSVGANTAAAAWAVLGRIQLSTDDLERAASSAEKGLRLAPLHAASALLASELALRNQSKGVALINRYFEQAGYAPDVRLLYARGLLVQQRLNDARVHALALTREHTTFPMGWLLLGTLEAEAGADEPARAALNQFLSVAATLPPRLEWLGPAQTQAYNTLSRVAERAGNNAEALVWLDKISANGDPLPQLTRRASLLLKDGRTEQGLALLQPPGNAPDEQFKRYALTEVQLLRDAKNHLAAYQKLTQMETRFPNDPDLQYELAMSADKIQRLDEMEMRLRRLIARQPDHHHAYNALGYSLADRGVQLDEAETLIKKALEFAPQDPFIQDSLGWVLYKRGDLPGALQVLEAAFNARPDAEIATHWGEVLWAAGQRDKANAMWIKARQLQPDNETLKETLSRLNVKL
jgi:predicted Zn-dependent protease